ncbi:MAG: hypothetical protein HRK26_03610 [Rickettsiaceae bacterium H1]|nr:hypothetical protein [Rickettsiaceae bacterium H1]
MQIKKVEWEISKHLAKIKGETKQIKYLNLKLVKQLETEDKEIIEYLELLEQSGENKAIEECLKITETDPKITRYSFKLEKTGKNNNSVRKRETSSQSNSRTR